MLCQIQSWISGMIITTRHSCPDICPCKISDRAVVVGYPLGRSTSNMPVSFCNREQSRLRTIWHVAYHVVAFLHTCVEWIRAKSGAPVCCLPRFRENREKRNLDDWRTRVRPQYCARLAKTMVFRRRWGETLLSLTSMDGSSLTWWEVG